MAKVRRSAIFTKMSGTIDQDHYVRTTRDGRTIISLKPDFSNRQFSEAQLGNQSRIQQAAAYAKVACKENPIYGMKAKGTAQNAYNVAISDWFKPPVIHRIERLAGCIRVQASDNVMVAKVTVTLMDDQERILEQGDARQVYESIWEYIPQSAGRVVVEAWDLPGNRTTAEA
jgi:hypothetical protein